MIALKDKPLTPWRGPVPCLVSFLPGKQGAGPTIPDCLVSLFSPSPLLTSAQKNLALVWVLKSFFLNFSSQTFVLYTRGSLFS